MAPGIDDGPARAAEESARAEAALADLTRQAEAFGSAISGAFKMAAAGGRDFESILENLALRLAGIVFDRAFSPLGDLIGKGIGGLTGQSSGAGAGSAPGRGGAAANGAPTVINLNVTTPDADGFRKSEAQVTAMLARAVGRGRRGL